jgi:hypothetical protein
MDETHFKQICELAAQALNVEPTQDDDGRYSFLIDGTEVLLDFDHEEETDRIFFYVDLGNVSPQDRAQVCEQLLELNLRQHGNGAYAFDINSARVIFCGLILDGDIMNGKYVAALLCDRLEQLDEIQLMISNPAIYAGIPPGEDQKLFIAAALA